ncbi:ribosome biogenesis GTPase Der [Methylobacterium sp. E-016]|uniref:ribosome biogenesis GTPase Der n=1 Tax=Methylobacterium sp. E-016 TaxID=2836556 RepID=UPI001FB9FC14|nr:ribosome biogenesis GTPase Der [Methylobacterium sp. E-016]MCJ2075479.1 ribosome biogenesis GTPase Der [Methylobacterium sp. E-016]
MELPTVAIVGRPNVGKSTLFNRLVGKKLALVDDRPGVTRDRREGDIAFGGLNFRIIDTAGLEEADSATLLGRMRMQTEAAILEADVVLFVIDARAGILPADQPFAELVRRAGCKVILIANKAEGGAGMAGAYESFRLGLGDPIPFSAEHGEGIGELHEALKEALPETDEDEDDDDPRGKPLKVAIVGRPNAGKSTLINRMLGEDRLLVGPEAGITRDSISLDWEWRGRRIKLHDTAGMRRRARIEDKLEKLAVSDGIRAVRFAEVVVVLLDATIPFEKQDLTIVDLVESEGRSLVIALNKWDLVADQPGLLKSLREDCTRLLPQVRGVAVVPLSGLAGDGVDKLMQAVVQAAEVWDTRISTSRINDWLSEATQRNPPPAVSGRRIKIRYATQVKSRPPHFALFGNQLNAMPKSYTRYLTNSLREAFALPGTPIRLSLRTSSNPFDKG